MSVLVLLVRISVRLIRVVAFVINNKILIEKKNKKIWCFSFKYIIPVVYYILLELLLLYIGKVRSGWCC